MAQKYHGDRSQGSPTAFPAVLTTRVMSAPLLCCALRYGACAPRICPLVRWSADTRQRDHHPRSVTVPVGRYVVAGIGLLAILALWPGCRVRLARWAAPAALALGLMQLIWIPLAAEVDPCLITGPFLASQHQI